MTTSQEVCRDAVCDSRGRNRKSPRESNSRNFDVLRTCERFQAVSENADPPDFVGYAV